MVDTAAVLGEFDHCSVVPQFPPVWRRGRSEGTRLFGSDPSLAADHAMGGPWARGDDQGVVLSDCQRTVCNQTGLLNIPSSSRDAKGEVRRTKGTVGYC